VSALDALLDRLPRTTLVVGKGGVGKTTIACGIAARLASRGDETLLLSTDPAAALASTIGAPVADRATPIPNAPRLHARQLVAEELRTEFLGRWRETIAEIVDRGTYLDRADVDGLVDAALPGADEIFALLALADLLAESTVYERIVVDTAPTGHTLRLLALPDTFRALLSMLDLMQSKHRFMVRALTRRYRRERADDFLDDMRARVDALRAALSDARSCAALVVTRAEPVVLVETGRYIESLRALHVTIAGLIVNGYAASRGSSALAPVAELDPSLSRLWISRAAQPPRGLAAVEALTASASDAPPTAIRELETAPRGPSLSTKTLSQLVRQLTVVAGKGGVGKSTVACALAIAAADSAAGDVLLVSTDPAPSLADALGESDAPWARADVEHRLPDPPRLVVRQMDATAAFARARDEYRDRIDALFAALVGRGVDIEQDRAILRDLMALAPPGIDELFAISILGDALAERRFDRVIVDPAPTGHLLRLLDMPAIALDWSHRLMRLMLKYQSVVALGDSAQQLLDFAKRTKALGALLHDPEACGVVIVALDEPVVRDETERLAGAVAARDMDVIAIVWNRLTRSATSATPLPATLAARQFFADEASPPPVGAASLRAWSRGWREHVTTS